MFATGPTRFSIALSGVLCLTVATSAQTDPMPTVAGSTASSSSGFLLGIGQPFRPLIDDVIVSQPCQACGARSSDSPCPSCRQHDHLATNEATDIQICGPTDQGSDPLPSHQAQILKVVAQAGAPAELSQGIDRACQEGDRIVEGLITPTDPSQQRPRGLDNVLTVRVGHPTTTPQAFHENLADLLMMTLDGLPDDPAARKRAIVTALSIAGSSPADAPSISNRAAWITNDTVARNDDRNPAEHTMTALPDGARTQFVRVSIEELQRRHQKLRGMETSLDTLLEAIKILNQDRSSEKTEIRNAMKANPHVHTEALKTFRNVGYDLRTGNAIGIPMKVATPPGQSEHPAPAAVPPIRKPSPGPEPFAWAPRTGTDFSSEQLMEVRARLDQLQRQIEQFAPPAQPTDHRELPPFVSHQIVQLQKQLQQIRDQVQSMARPSMTEGPLQPIFQSGQTLEPLRK